MLKALRHIPTIRVLERFFRSVTVRAKFWLLALIPVVAVLAVLFLAGTNNHSQETIRISLDQKSEIPPVQQIGDAQREPIDGVLRVAIAGVLSPSKTLEHYQELLDFMEQKLEKQVTMLLKPTYAEINDLIRGQRADVAFVCTLAYVEGNRDFGMELLLAPQMYGQTVYYSYLIVPTESSATGLENLRGASFAFTDPMSNSGHLAPTYQLYLLGEEAVSFFSNHIFTYSHDNSIIAVADKLVGGAAVDSLVYDKIIADNPQLAAKTRVIARWGPFGIPPVVIGPTLDPQVKSQLSDFFLELHLSDEGTEILNNLDIDKFVLVSDDLYDSIREMKNKLRW